MQNIVLFDDPDRWKDLWPLTLTRPISKCITGILTIEEKWAKYTSSRIFILPVSSLEAVFKVVWPSDSLFINSSVLPDWKLSESLSELDRGTCIRFKNNIIAFRPNIGDLITDFDSISQFVDSYKMEEYDCTLIQYPEDLNKYHNSEFLKDFGLITSSCKGVKPLKNVQIYGNDVFLEEGAQLTGCSLNSMTGPIYIGRNAQVMEMAAIRGPVALRSHATVHMGAKIYSNTTIADHCKIGGEVKRSIIFPHSNKAHDGYLGDSVIGSWCNMGADTNVSNMKNTYGDISIMHIATGDYRNTGLQFQGTIMGDHSMCAINTSFYTGTVVGVFSHVFNTKPDKFMQSFRWGNNESIYDLDKAIIVAKRAMGRRGIALTNEYFALLKVIYDQFKEP